MQKQKLHFKTILFILLGIFVGIVLFLLGDADDAPGLSFLGLSAAFLLIMRGIFHSGWLPKGYAIPIVLFVFGMVGLLFPFILFWDGEIAAFSAVFFIGNTAGIVLLLLALWRILHLKKKR